MHFQKRRPTNFKLGIQMEHEDSYHRQALWPLRLKVKVAWSCSPSDRCWPISRERKVPETPKLVTRLITPLAITRSRFEVKRSKVKVTMPINAETESESPTNFKLSRWLEHALSNAMTSYKGLYSWVIARGRGNIVSAAPGGYITCYSSLVAAVKTWPIGLVVNW